MGVPIPNKSAETSDCIEGFITTGEVMKDSHHELSITLTRNF